MKELEKYRHQLVYNALQTPDGTVIHSKYRHDYVCYTDKNGKDYMVDGGNAYLRRSINYDQKDLSKTVGDCKSLDEVASYLHWGVNYDKDMNLLPNTVWKPLNELDKDHIKAIVDGGYCKNELYLIVFEYLLNK